MVDRTEGRRTKIAAALAAAALWLGAVAAPADDEARELVRRALDASGAKTASARMTLRSGSESREIEMLRRRHEGSDRVQIKVTAPFNYKGMRYVFQQEANGSSDHYSYLPAMKRTLRVAEDAIHQPFLATEFFVADMIPPDLSESDYRFVGEEKVAGRACRLVESVPRGSLRSLYGRTVMAIDSADLVIVRTEFFDPDGKPLKVWTIDRLEKIDDVWTPLEQTMKPADGRPEWKIVIDEIEYGVAIGESDFAPVGLDR